MRASTLIVLLCGAFLLFRPSEAITVSASKPAPEIASIELFTTDLSAEQNKVVAVIEVTNLSREEFSLWKSPILQPWKPIDGRSKSDTVTDVSEPLSVIVQFELETRPSDKGAAGIDSRITVLDKGVGFIGYRDQTTIKPHSSIYLKFELDREKLNRAKAIRGMLCSAKGAIISNVISVKGPKIDAGK